MLPAKAAWSLPRRSDKQLFAHFAPGAQFGMVIEFTSAAPKPDYHKDLFAKLAGCSRLTDLFDASSPQGHCRSSSELP